MNNILHTRSVSDCNLLITARAKSSSEKRDGGADSRGQHRHPQIERLLLHAAIVIEPTILSSGCKITTGDAAQPKSRPTPGTYSIVLRNRRRLAIFKIKFFLGIFIISNKLV